MYVPTHSPERGFVLGDQLLSILTLQLTLQVPLDCLFSSLDISFSLHGIVVRIQ